MPDTPDTALTPALRRFLSDFVATRGEAAACAATHLSAEQIARLCTGKPVKPSTLRFATVTLSALSVSPREKARRERELLKAWAAKHLPEKGQALFARLMAEHDAKEAERDAKDAEEAAKDAELDAAEDALLELTVAEIAAERDAKDDSAEEQ